MRVGLVVAICLTVISVSVFAEEFHQPPWVSAAKCTTKDAIAADSDLDRLTNWAAVHNSFKRYKQCDDASIGEGYSDKVVMLLTKHWPTITTLASLAQADPEFGDFVLSHVDELMSPDQSKFIIDNAGNRCPAAAEKLCRRLEAKAKDPF